MTSGIGTLGLPVLTTTVTTLPALRTVPPSGRVAITLPLGTVRLVSVVLRKRIPRSSSRPVAAPAGRLVRSGRVIPSDGCSTTVSRRRARSPPSTDWVATRPSWTWSEATASPTWTRSPRPWRSRVASATSSPTTSGTRTDPPSRPPARVSSPAASRPTTSSTASSRPLPILARRARVLGTRPVVGRGRRCAGVAGGSRVASLATVVHPSRLRVSAAPGGAWPPSVVAPAAAAQEAVVSGPLGRSVVARRASSTRRRRGAPMAAAKSEARR